jgi:hypothetical protein
MKTGALIFAFNNEQIDYVSMARWSAKNIERHLGIPTHVVTDQEVKTVGTNDRWFEDFGTQVTWHNESRVNAYELSPWDQTLVLDADYVVASNQLQTVLDSQQDFLAHRWAYDITGINDFSDLNHFGQHRMPMWWATVMMFRRSDHARLIFESMTMICDNWTHYKRLYKNRSPNYRNDHALSIALATVNGHTLDHAGIPWNLASLTPEHQLTQIDTDEYRVDFLNQEKKPRWIQLRNQDFHAMGKRHLGAIVANNT